MDSLKDRSRRTSSRGSKAEHSSLAELPEPDDEREAAAFEVVAASAELVESLEQECERLRAIVDAQARAIRQRYVDAREWLLEACNQGIAAARGPN